MYTAMRARECDVLVIGAGNAAMCAALAARRAGASVVVLERAPRERRGGNSRFTRNIRVVHDDGDPVMAGSYTEEEFAGDLAGVTDSTSDPALARLVVEGSRDASRWMELNGARWQRAISGTLQLTRTNRFFLGGGKALMNAYFATAERLGVAVEYGHTVTDIHVDGSAVTGVTFTDGDRERGLSPGCVVAASGGFEANLEWLGRYWGTAAQNYFVRGARENDGLVLSRLITAGALPRGNERGFHAIAVDGRGPRFEGGIVTRIDSVPFSVTVNRDGRRFYDEGEDLWPKRYATWGRLIAEQPDQVAFSIFDSKVMGRFMTTVFPPLSADTVEELASRLDIAPSALVATVNTYNEKVRPGVYDPGRLDTSRTEGLDPAKSHWALPIDEPPFYAYPLAPGITFTYLGLAIDQSARVLRTDGGAFDNVFAAGEIIAGNILSTGYLAGFGMTIGTVFGRIAGEEAARCAIA